MGFLDPKREQEDDDALPGASGLRIDLDQRVCPACRREALPWEATCVDCGEVPVHPTEVPASSFPLPAHLFSDPDDPDDGAAADGIGGDSSRPGQTDDPGADDRNA